MSRVFLDPGPAPAGQNEGSNVDVTVMPDFINKYLHLAYGSFDTVFNGGTPLLFWPTPSEQWTWISVSQGRALGVTGPNARHLHFDTHDSAGTTVPNVFRSYFESNDDGTTWTFITAGRPREDSLVKR